MSTRSTVSLLTNDNKVMSVYVHFDGYLSHNGAILTQQYTNYDDVFKLVSLGDMSSLPDINCLLQGELESYGDEYPAKVYESIFDWYSDMPYEEYNYIFIDDTWYLYTPSKLVSVAEKINTVVTADGGEEQFSQEDICQLCQAILKGLMIPGRAYIRGYFGLKDVIIRLDDGIEANMTLTLYHNKFFDAIGLARLMLEELKSSEEAEANKMQCRFVEKDVDTLKLAEKYKKMIQGYDRAKYVSDDTADLYFNHFINLIIKDLSGSDQELDELDPYYQFVSCIPNEARKIKGYILKKIQKLVSSMPDDDKKSLFCTFTRGVDDNSYNSGLKEYLNPHAVILGDYERNLTKYGKGYVDAMELLKQKPLYKKIYDLCAEYQLKCKEQFFDQVISRVR